jgi:hypothetical protein
MPKSEWKVGQPVALTYRGRSRDASVPSRKGLDESIHLCRVASVDSRNIVLGEPIVSLHPWSPKSELSMLRGHEDLTNWHVHKITEAQFATISKQIKKKVADRKAKHAVEMDAYHRDQKRRDAADRMYSLIQRLSAAWKSLPEDEAVPDQINVNELWDEAELLVKELV